MVLRLTFAFVVLASLALGASSCAASRQGWGGGSSFVVKDLERLQVRRSPMRIDPRNGELVLSWIGARAVDGAPDILECSFTAFDDRNGDGRPQPAEIVRQRTSLDRVRKVIFDDLRFADGRRSRPLRALLVVRTDRERREVRLALTAD